MAGYEILFKDSVFKDLQAIPKTDLRKILSRIERWPTIRALPASRS